MLVAVTGGMGFIGQEVISLLQDRGHEVILVDFWTDLIARYEREQLPIIESVYRTGARVGSFMTPLEFRFWMEDSCPDVIVHLGAVVDTMDLGSENMFRQNVEFTRELVRLANLGRTSEYIPGIVFASSAAVYGSKGFPSNPYGFTKCIGEKAVAGTRGDFVSLRFFNVFGRNEHHKGQMASVPFKLFKAYCNGDKFDLHSPEAARDFVPVSTVAAKAVAYAELFDQRRRSPHSSSTIRDTLDLGTGYATTFADLDSYVMQATLNYVSCARYVPIPKQLVGRYQPYTCAGQRIKNCGEGTADTRTAIQETYGS